MGINALIANCYWPTRRIRSASQPGPSTEPRIDTVRLALGRGTLMDYTGRTGMESPSEPSELRCARHIFWVMRGNYELDQDEYTVDDIAARYGVRTDMSVIIEFDGLMIEVDDGWLKRFDGSAALEAD